jgi:LysR family transcriptional regulator, low CO2-responsive transcriptional regulator
MNYTLNQLRIFLAVVNNGSVTKAAEELHLTQPAVSIQLKNFQDQFDIPLMQLINRRVFITDFGKEIAEAADRILSEVYAINFRMHSHKGLLTGKLKLSVVSTGKYVAPYFVSGFIKQHEGVELLMDVTNKAQVMASMERNEVDFALVSVLPENYALEKIELLQNKLYVVGNDEKTFKKKQYDKDVFSNIPLIYREQGSGTRQVMEGYIRRAKLPVVKKMELTSNEAVKQAVIAGLGYSIMPLIGIRNELENGQLQIIPVKGFPIKSKWYLIWQKNKAMSPVAKEFINFIKKEKEHVIESSFKWFEQF